MSSRIIPESFIQASSEREGNPAYHARLGGKSFWCSQKEHFRNYLTIDFPRSVSAFPAAILVHQNGIPIWTNMASPYKALQRCVKRFGVKLWATKAWELDLASSTGQFPIYYFFCVTVVKKINCRSERQTNSRIKSTIAKKYLAFLFLFFVFCFLKL